MYWIISGIEYSLDPFGNPCFAKTHYTNTPFPERPRSTNLYNSYSDLREFQHHSDNTVNLVDQCFHTTQSNGAKKGDIY